MNVKQNGIANVGTDAREGLVGPEANASGPFFSWSKTSPMPQVQRLGTCKKSLSFMFKLHEGGMPENGILLPPKLEPAETQTPTTRGDPIIAKAVKMADRYHNPDPFI